MRFLKRKKIDLRLFFYKNLYNFYNTLIKEYSNAIKRLFFIKTLKKNDILTPLKRCFLILLSRIYQAVKGIFSYSFILFRFRNEIKNLLKHLDDIRDTLHLYF